jgi:hydroxymethylbilane synthase
MPHALRIGTRGSPLALAQANIVQEALENASAKLDFDIEASVHPFTTVGDKVTDRPLYDLGGKGLFTKEIDRALMAGEINCAVHSLKDMESALPDGVIIAAVLERADPRDCLIGAEGLDPDSLAHGARVGTSAVRRRAQLLSQRPDLAVVPMRGNVETRLSKLGRGEADAILLAKAGLDRLGRADVITRVLEPEEMLPAVGQGIIAIVARTSDVFACQGLALLDHEETHIRARAERALLARVDGSCRSPIAAHAHLEGGKLIIEGALFSPDGEETVRGRMEGEPKAAEALGTKLGDELLGKASPAILAVLGAH